MREDIVFPRTLFLYATGKASNMRREKHTKGLAGKAYG